MAFCVPRFGSTLQNFSCANFCNAPSKVVLTAHEELCIADDFSSKVDTPISKQSSTAFSSKPRTPSTAYSRATSTEFSGSVCIGRNASLEVALADKVAKARIVGAHRELIEAEASNANCTPETPHSTQLRERIRQIASMFEESCAFSVTTAKDGWVTEKCNDNVQYSFRLHDNSIQMVSTAIYEDCDIVTGLAALCEADLCMGYKANVLSAEPLDERYAAHSLWRIHQTGMISGKLEDNLVQISVVDALDEPVNSMWVCLSPPRLEGGAEFYGVPIPAADPGVERYAQGWTTCRMTPIRGSGKSASPAFEMSMTIFGPAPRALNAMPTFALKIFMRKGAQDTMDRFCQHLKTCELLNERIYRSPRAEMYQQVSRHVQAKLGTLRLMKTPQASDSLVQAFGGDAPVARPTDASTPPSSTWEELSTQLPITWADFNEGDLISQNALSVQYKSVAERCRPRTLGREVMGPH